MRYTVFFAVAVLLVALGIAWSFVPMSALDAASLARYRDTLQAMPLAPLIVVVAFILFGFVSAPATMLVAATLVCFGTTRGLAYAYVGMLASGCTVRAVARFGARDIVGRWLARRADSRIAGLQRLVKRRGMLAVIAMRLTPTPFTIQNVIAGVADVRLVDFVIGTAIGIVPMMALVTGVTSQLDAWLDDPTWTRGFAAVVVAAAVALVAWAVRHRRRAG
jgi:phospholipase D1/2